MTTATIVYDEEQMESLELADEFFNMAEHNMEAVQETVSDTIIISLRTTLADELHTRDLCTCSNSCCAGPEFVWPVMF